MKKLLSILFITQAFITFSQAPTTCSNDAVFVALNKPGIWPDSATNFVQGMVGVPYGQNITVRVPKDTVQSPLTFCFNRIELATPTGYTNFNLPPGLNLLAGPTVTNTAGTYKYRGNAVSCSIISGTPTVAGTYTLQFKVQPFLTLSTPLTPCSNTPNYAAGSGSLTAPTTVKYYIIQINPNTVGLKEDVNSKSLNLTNVPNPFSGKTTLRFNVKDESIAKICVYNLLGEKIFTDNVKTIYGDNSYELDGTNWTNGIYLYTIQYKNHTETKRMVLAGNR